MHNFNKFETTIYSPFLTLHQKNSFVRQPEMIVKIIVLGFKNQM